MFVKPKDMKEEDIQEYFHFYKYFRFIFVKRENRND